MLYNPNVFNMVFYMKVQLFVGLLIFIQVFECANILILHPLYAGSHELTLRSIGNHLVKERGHNVTQVMFQHTNMNVSMLSQSENLVNIVPFRIRDTNKECTRYINEDGQFDIGSFSSEILWKYGDKPWQLPTDLFCVTRVHCNMVLNDPILFESLNSSNYDIGTYITSIKYLPIPSLIPCIIITFVMYQLLFPSYKCLLELFVYYLYILLLIFLGSFFVLFMASLLLALLLCYFYRHFNTKVDIRLLLNT